MVTVTVRYFGGARAAAGRASESASAVTLADLRDTLVRNHGQRLEKVLTACSFLVDGVAARQGPIVLASGSTVDVLPPFAGG
jgi:molybdopterin converting factor small subunit